MSIRLKSPRLISQHPRSGVRCATRNGSPFSQPGLVASLLATWLCVVPNLAAQDHATAILSVPAKMLDPERSPASPTESATPTGMMAPPAATLPAQRRPQYQSGYQRSEQLSQFAQGEIRFVLLAPELQNSQGHPILVRVVANIDGRPFTEQRKQLATLLLSDENSASGSAPSTSDDENELATTSQLDPSRETQSFASGSAVDTSTTAGNDQEPKQGDSEETEAGESPEPELATNAYRLSTEADEVARRYAEATGEPLSEEEANWIVTHWTEGPALLLLHPYFQAFRANERPAFRVLDRDRDNTISTKELESAVQSLEECDANRDQIVDVMEIAAVAAKLRDISPAPASDTPLLLLVDDLRGIAKDSEQLFRTLKPFDSNKNGRIEDVEVDELLQAEPDIDLTVDFDTTDPNASRLTLTASSLPDPHAEPSPFSASINLTVSDRPLQFIAIQGPASRQVSLGAVQDGYPLLPSLDPNDDGRFTIRERRELNERLADFDTNEDGVISSNEAIAPIRICIGLGGTAHRELAGVRASRTMTGRTPAITGPDWFVRMDRNKDNDLSRNEFSGNDEQFQALDADQDELISASEANDFDQAANTQ